MPNDYVKPVQTQACKGRECFLLSLILLLCVTKSQTIKLVVLTLNVVIVRLHISHLFEPLTIGHQYSTYIQDV